MARKKHAHIHGSAGFTPEQHRRIKASNERRALAGIAPSVRLEDAPPVAPRTRTPPSRYVSWAPNLPQTLAELGSACEDYRHAAVIDAQWRAVDQWATKSPTTGTPCKIPHAAAAVFKVRYTVRSELGFPSLSGKPYSSMDPSPEERATAEKVMAAWEAEGFPHLAEAITSTHQDIVLYLRKYPPAKDPARAHSPA